MNDMSKNDAAKPPALSSVKKLEFKPNPALKLRLVNAGMLVQKEIEDERKSRIQSVDKALRVIVR